MSNTHVEGRSGGARRGADNQESSQVNKKTPLNDVQRGGTPATTDQDAEHEGATEQQVGDRGGPGVGFDQEPEREKNEGGVS